MGWLFKRHKGDIFVKVRINDRIQLEMAGKSFLSRVEDIQSEEIHIAAPVERGSLVQVRTGQGVMVNVFAGESLRRFSATIKKTINGTVPLVVLTGFKDQGELQRRTFFRLPDQVPARYRVEDGANNIRPWNHSVTRDVSGGGCQLLVGDEVEPLAQSDLVEIELTLPGEQIIKAVASVIRISRLPGGIARFSLALQFVHISQGDQRKIVQYTYKRQTELKSAASKETRLNRDVIAQYRKQHASDAGARSGHAYEMSIKGFQMLVGDASGLTPGDVLQVKLSFAGLGSTDVECEIVWVRLSNGVQHNSFDVYVRFEELSKDAHRLISKFIEENNGDRKAA